MNRSVWLLACGAVAVIMLLAPAVGASASATGGVKQFKDESAIAGVNSGPARAAAQALADERLLTGDRVEAFLRALAALRGDTKAWQVYLTYSDMVVPYLRDRQPAVLESLRRFASGAASGEALVALLGAAAKKLTPNDFIKWIAASSTPSQAELAQLWKLSPEQLHKATAGAALAGATLDTSALAAAAPDLRDPKVQIVDFAARLKTFNQTLGFAKLPNNQTRREPRVPSKPANLNVGLQSFKARKIGIVVHVFQFQDEYGYLYPPGAYMNGMGRAQTLVNYLNKFYRYSGANIQFYLKQYRSDTKKYPYLNLKTVEDWQACGAGNQYCTCAYAEKYGLASDRFINIFVAGAAHQYEGLSTDAALASSSVIPPMLDMCMYVESGNLTGMYDQDVARSFQHIWTQWEAFDTLKYNTYLWAQAGANTIAHEIGHFLGLLHTFQGSSYRISCATSNDGIADTPTDLNQGEQGNAYTVAAGTLCRRMAKQGKVTAKDLAAMDEFDSCPDNRYMDNLFNIMSYTPSASCSLYFTRGQIAKMQWVLSKAQSHLGT